MKVKKKTTPIIIVWPSGVWKENAIFIYLLLIKEVSCFSMFPLMICSWGLRGFLAFKQEVEYDMGRDWWVCCIRLAAIHVLAILKGMKLETIQPFPIHNTSLFPTNCPIQLSNQIELSFTRD